MLWSQDSLSGLLICVFAGQLLCIGRWMIYIALWTEHTGGEEERRYSAIALVGSEMPMQRTCMDVHMCCAQLHKRTERWSLPTSCMLVFCPRWVYHDVLWKMSVFWTCFRQGFPRGTSVFSFQDTSIQNPGRIISIPCVPLLATLLPF